MVIHDVAMDRFRQWWRRAVRAGHAFAECSWIHRRGPLTMWKREVFSNWFWGLLLPAFILALIPLTRGLSLLLAIGYPVLALLRVYRGRRRHGDGAADARAYAWFCVVGKFAHAWGQLGYHWGDSGAARSPDRIQGNTRRHCALDARNCAGDNSTARFPEPR